MGIPLQQQDGFRATVLQTWEWSELNNNMENTEHLLPKLVDRNLQVMQFYYVSSVMAFLPSNQGKAMGSVDIAVCTRLLIICATGKSLAEGKILHARIVKHGLESDVYLTNNLVNMYVKCALILDARQVFDKMPKRNVISWTAMIAGYAQNEQGKAALKLYCQMQRTGMESNQFTFASILRACAGLAALEQGKQVHAHVIRTGFESNVFVGGALIDMYAKCRNIDNARHVFDKMSKRDAVSWNAMIAGYALNGHGGEALEQFCQMQSAGMKPYQVTFSSALRGCTAVLALEQGKQVHAHILKIGLHSDAYVGSALVDMYSKCGGIQDASQMFGEMTKRDVVAWNAMIAGYAHHGLGEEVLQLFEQMQLEGMKPTHSTFVSVLSACSHVGLLDVGRRYFNSMCRDHGVTPSVEHYACMVDLLGRAGCLDEAQDLIKEIPFEPGAVVWRTLLGASRIHGNVAVAERAAESILKLDPQDTGTCLLLSNVYAAAHRWNDVLKVRKFMKDRGLIKKEPGSSWIWVKGMVHTFVTEDRTHPRMEEIYKKLVELTGQMRQAGYVPDTNIELHDTQRAKMGHCPLSP